MNLEAVSQILGSIDRELWVVTAAGGEQRGGLIATTLCRASIVPDLPRVLVSVARQHATWSLLEASGAFAAHLVDEERVAWVRRFGLQSGRDVDKLAGLEWRTGPSGSPILTEAAAWLDCRVENRMETGDRTVYLAEVLDGGCRADFRPLTVSRLLDIAPQETIDELKRQLAADADRDRLAIRAWQRSADGTSP